MGTERGVGLFRWDADKEETNIAYHGISFTEAVDAFLDPGCLILEDKAHSKAEPRYFCVGKTRGRIAVVRFTYRGGFVRIIGAGYWRKWRKLYEKKNAN